MNNILMKMTDAYEHQSFYNNRKNIKIIDCRDVEGTRCYLDDMAKSKLLSRISGFSAEGIHFIDSGNYHYLSLLWLMKVQEDFNLVLFDHHPDNQPPSFGMITSCGGWVLEATEVLPHLKNVYTYGVGEEVPVSEIPIDLPLYISIDKDALSLEAAITDWDQGDMSLDMMLEMLESLFEGRRIIGVDICGDSGENAENGAKINNQTNARLFDFLSENF
ncbi:hypothetical protein [Pseudobutyrivibrio xylanivorans]|uniref:Arginase family protein n=1 Tax=Pseudobutyrivibrio xylanivorans TaxID=185007 RepID=A0A5P6VNW2_PSEXY|nr:hypothetical protein [Pseudobutyrivibrio xylanivorans]QFJ54355.1 hypothetical protein FXF36_05540 [Pseudobutyrivibrio xylanivorans]